MIICAFSSSSVPHIPKSSLHTNPAPPFNKIKNPKIFFGSSSNVNPAATLTHFCVNSPLRASVKCFSQREEEKQQLEQVYEFERLFSNLNQATLQREPGINSQSLLFLDLFSILYISSIAIMAVGVM